MNLDLKNIKNKFREFVSHYKKYASFVFIVIILCLYTFLVYQISRFSLAEPDPAAVDAKVQSIGRLKIDQESINKIQQLEDQNINVQSLFESARDNPFQDQ